MGIIIILSVIYCIKMLIKANQIHAGFPNMHALSSIVILRLYIKRNKNYRS